MCTPGHGELWRLARGVHAARVEAELVFLDAEADRYLCLPGAAEVICVHPEWRALEVRDAAVAQDLQAAGLVDGRSAPDEPLERRPEAPRPTVSAVCDAYPRFRLADVAPMARSVADVLQHYRGRRFAEILRVAQGGRPSSGRPASAAAVQSTVEAFHRWSPYAPLSAKCLLRSFLLLRLLHRQGFDAQWVFGVATWPFRAHCWLQIGERVLDDRIDRLAAFTPILVV